MTLVLPELRPTYSGVTNLDEAKREWHRLCQEDSLGSEAEKLLIAAWPALMEKTTDPSALVGPGDLVRCTRVDGRLYFAEDPEGPKP